MVETCWHEQHETFQISTALQVIKGCMEFESSHANISGTAMERSQFILPRATDTLWALHSPCLLQIVPSTAMLTRV